MEFRFKMFTSSGSAFYFYDKSLDMDKDPATFSFGYTGNQRDNRTFMNWNAGMTHFAFRFLLDKFPNKASNDCQEVKLWQLNSINTKTQKNQKGKWSGGCK